MWCHFVTTLGRKRTSSAIRSSTAWSFSCAAEKCYIVVQHGFWTINIIIVQCSPRSVYAANRHLDWGAPFASRNLQYQYIFRPQGWRLVLMQGRMVHVIPGFSPRLGALTWHARVLNRKHLALGMETFLPELNNFIQSGVHWVCETMWNYMEYVCVSHPVPRDFNPSSEILLCSKQGAWRSIS